MVTAELLWITVVSLHSSFAAGLTFGAHTTGARPALVVSRRFVNLHGVVGNVPQPFDDGEDGAGGSGGQRGASQ